MSCALVGLLEGTSYGEFQGLAGKGENVLLVGDCSLRVCTKKKEIGEGRSLLVSCCMLLCLLCRDPWTQHCRNQHACLLGAESTDGTVPVHLTQTIG